MRKFKSSKKSNTKKVKYTINTKSNVIFEDTNILKLRGMDFKNTIKFIVDPKEPFFKENIKD